MSLPISIAVSKIRCRVETDEVGADEPYVLATAVRLQNPISNVEVTLYGPWSDVDKGETHGTVAIPAGVNAGTLPPVIVWRRPCWGLNGQPAPIPNPESVILLFSLMENDDGHPDALRTTVKLAAVGSLAASTGSPRNERVRALIRDIDGARKLPTGAPNFDDLVGPTQELPLTSSLLNVAGGPKTKTLTFRGDGGVYDVTVEFRKG
jgi:hypothetical protein